MRTLALTSLLLGCAFALAACGGSAADASIAPAETADTNNEAPPTPPPAPADPQLDADLAPLLENAGVQGLAPPAERAAALVALGRALFFDKLLSGNRDIACATCHHPSAATGDALSVSIGAGGFGTGASRQPGSGALIARNAPPLFNRGLPGVRRLFWDARVSRSGGPGGGLQTPEPALNGPSPSAREVAVLLDTPLAAQALFPLLSGDEMRGAAGENEIADAPDNLTAWARLMARLVGTDSGRIGGIPAYRDLFLAAYPNVGDTDELTIGHLARAIGAYEDVTYRALGTPLDAYLAGDRTALTDEEKRGAILFFGRADCGRCHRGPLLSDGQLHAIAVPQVGPGKDFPFEDSGRALVTGSPDDRYRFLTPPLRNVELTGPWMHDGAFTSLRAAVAHYDDPVRSLREYDASPLSPLLQPTVDRDSDRIQARADALDAILRPAPRLNGRDVDQLLAFLGALTDPSSRDLSAEVPAAVPSGLPVDD